MTSILEKEINTIRKKIQQSKSTEFELDLSSMNIFEASKVAVMSSALYYSKNPDGKIKCKLKSDNIKEFIAGLSIQNIEFI